MKVAFLGATKGMGRALARQMAERGDELCLLGRDVSNLERSAADLKIRGAAGQLKALFCDLEQPQTFAPALADARDAMGGLETVVVTAGIFAIQEQLENDMELVARMFRINFSNTVLFCEEAKNVLLGQGGGTLCVFSSVAGERGRKPVIIYGATKAGLTYYLEGLDHKHRTEGLRVVTVKPGFVKTSMVEDLEPPPFAGEPVPVALRVLRALDRGAPVVYAPASWKYIMAVIRALPRAVMRRVGF